MRNFYFDGLLRFSAPFNSTQKRPGNYEVLELGIVVHSVVIGLSLGASNNTCTIKPLVAILCFHQMFEGMGLGGCILQQVPSLRPPALCSEPSSRKSCMT
ncbi:hypothetical protein Syun_013888 [Stephania yunnanensis]|uniref:Uncharacterized protein n=1 Tax=Stephania yunnanensis TaxID=152371 RepID=A0AAP0P845_9MAGN